MTINELGELICSKEEYTALHDVLAEQDVNLNWSVTDCHTYKCYVRNPYKEVVGLWGSDLEKNLAKEFYDRYNR